MRLIRSTSVGPGMLTVWAAALLLAAPVAAQAQVGTVSGRVTAVGSNEPLSDARILVVNTSRVATTDVEGRYTVRNVPAGNVDVRVLRVGYQEQKKTVQLSAGGTANVDFVMSQAVILLPDVVTTATGEQRRVELGNAVTAISDVNSRVETTPVSNCPSICSSPRRRASSCFRVP